MLLNEAQGEGEVRLRPAPLQAPSLVFHRKKKRWSLSFKAIIQRNTHHVPFPLSPSTALLCHIRHLRAHPDRAGLHWRAPGPDKGT